jgi:hypothetical protein
MLKDRLNTRELLKRKTMVLPNYNCVLCTQNVEETVLHLFLDCPFSKQCWSMFNLRVISRSSGFQVMESFIGQLAKPLFMEIIIIMCWSIWSVRNAYIFENEVPTVQKCKAAFKATFALLLRRAKLKFSPETKIWLESLV